LTAIAKLEAKKEKACMFEIDYINNGVAVVNIELCWFTRVYNKCAFWETQDLSGLRHSHWESYMDGQ